MSADNVVAFATKSQLVRRGTKKQVQQMVYD
jgi:hypothetical protein